MGLLRLGGSNGDLNRSAQMGVRSSLNRMKWGWGLGETSRHGRHLRWRPRLRSLRLIREKDEMGEVKRWERKREPKMRIRGGFCNYF
ncbi:hypothetical protein IC582_012653 [Cucumis melo]